jgi:hypothetical protein
MPGAFGKGSGGCHLKFTGSAPKRSIKKQQLWSVGHSAWRSPSQRNKVLNHLSWIFNPILFITIHHDLPDFLAGCRFSTRHQFQVLICYHECHIMLSYLDTYRRNRKTMKNLQQLLGRRTTNPCAARGQASELSQASRRFRWTVLDRGITRNWAGQRCQLRERLQNGCTSPGRCHANQESMGGKN